MTDIELTGFGLGPQDPNREKYEKELLVWAIKGRGPNGLITEDEVAPEKIKELSLKDLRRLYLGVRRRT